MTPLRLARAWILLLACALPQAAGAEPPAPAEKPAPVAGQAEGTVPAGADEGPSKVGPLPVVDDAPRDDFGMDPQEDPPSLSGTLFKMLLSLGLVILLVYLSLNFGLRKLMGVKGMPGQSGVVRVVERIPLDPKRALFVLHAAGEYLLVGGADENLSLISRLDAAEVQKVLDQRQKARAQASPFLQKLLSRERAAPPAPPDPPPPAPKV